MPEQTALTIAKSEYAWSKFHLGFWICQDSEYDKVVNMRRLQRLLNMPDKPEYALICLDIFQ